MRYLKNGIHFTSRKCICKEVPINSAKMDSNNYIRNDIHWLVRGIPLHIFKEMLDDVDEGKNYELLRNERFKKLLKYTSSQGSFFIKHYSVKNMRDIFKSLFSPSKAQREWERGRLLLKNQVLTAEPVAVGEKRCFKTLKDCYIISQAIPNSKSLKERLIDIQQSTTEHKHTQKSILLKNLISYIGTLHNNNIFHGELHAENILVSQNDSLFYLIDLARLKCKSTASLTPGIKDIARLVCSIRDVCTDGEITELINQYAHHTVIDKNREVFYKAVFAKIYKTQCRLWNGRVRRCLKNNNKFTVTVHNSFTIYMRNEWNVIELSDAIDKHLLSLKEHPDNVIKVSSRVCITRIPVSNKTVKSACIKEHQYPSLIKKILYHFFHSPAKKSWLAAHGLTELNFSTPKPIALFEEKKFGRLRRSFLVMEDVSAYLTCDRYVNEKFRNSPDVVTVRKKRMFISCLAKSFRQLHTSGIYHSDLKANNIMVVELPDTWNFSYLDLDRVYFYKKITDKQKIKNLSQINASLPHCITYTDRLRFYQIYAGIKKLNGRDKQILKEIISISIRRNHVWMPGVPIIQASSSTVGAREK
ncbi:MAG: hypothetical protein E3K32_00095 [wastewater metagenome]|nr:hypothetical protein [Candidatus Loosdrechtia aerotolerans]